MTETQAFLELLSMLVLDLRTGPLLALLATAAVIDWRTMRIPNWLTGAGMVFGLLLNAVSAPTPLAGVGSAAGGLAVGLLLLLPLWFIRILGAGDVKLMAAVGSFLGASAVLGALVWVVVAGGLVALVVTAFRGALTRLGQNLWFMVSMARLPHMSGGAATTPPMALSVGKFPYGISICLGTATYLIARQFGVA